MSPSQLALIGAPAGRRGGAAGDWHGGGAAGPGAGGGRRAAERLGRGAAGAGRRGAQRPAADSARRALGRTRPASGGGPPPRVWHPQSQAVFYF